MLPSVSAGDDENVVDVTAHQRINMINSLLKAYENATLQYEAPNTHLLSDLMYSFFRFYSKPY